jgi:hypothetical protein
LLASVTAPAIARKLGRLPRAVPREGSGRHRDGQCSAAAKRPQSLAQLKAEADDRDNEEQNHSDGPFQASLPKRRNAMTTFQGPMDEKKAVIENEARLRHPSQELREPDTYFSRARQPDLSKPLEPKPTLQVPRLPASSPWSGDPVPAEPLHDGTAEGITLGYPIDRVDHD